MVKEQGLRFAVLCSLFNVIRNEIGSLYGNMICKEFLQFIMAKQNYKLGNTKTEQNKKVKKSNKQKSAM